MKLIAASFAVTLLVGAGISHHAWAQNPQQDRMKACNAQAGTQKLAGDARKSFMSDCLSGKTPAAAAVPQTPQERMKSCNTQAAGKTGDDRKTFMSNCLHG